MAIRWRELFDSLGVPWTDTGRNTARGWISIPCPWCRDDPSEHLGINEEQGHYHCLRRDTHDGRSPFWLLKALGVDHRDMDDLLKLYGYNGSGRPPPTGVREGGPSAIRPALHGGPPFRWSQFTPAADNDEALDYLWGRNFPDPEKTCREFDLRIGRGKWARRLWFKLTDLAGNIVGFTGRTFDEWREPRYYTEAPGAQLYLPKLPNHHHRLGLCVEGPIDTLRIADVTQRRRNLLIIGLMGLSATGHRRLLLSQIARTVPVFVVALDATVWPVDAQRLMSEVRAIPAIGRVSRLAMPPDRDDPGEMSNTDVEQWLSTL
jgi:hypothetical protein